MTRISGDVNLTTTDKRRLAEVSQSAAGMIERVKVWSNINSGSFNREGLRKMRGPIEAAFAELGADISNAPLPDGEYVAVNGVSEKVGYEPSILVRQRPEAPVQLVMTGHYDTVFPKDSAFQAWHQIDGDTLGGPGTADMKGGIIVMLEALKALEKTPGAENVGYSVLLSPDEEIGSPGSAAPLAELGRVSHIGLTYEPTLPDGSLTGARKGSGNFTLVVRGKAAHAGREHHLGRNAIAAMSEFVMGIEALNGKRDGVTFNIGKIDGGGPVNIVPELAIGRFNVRMAEKADMAWIDTNLSKLIAGLNVKDGISAHLHGGFTRPPKPLAPANKAVMDWVQGAGELLGLSIKYQSSGGVCEGNNLWASGCPNVDTLGVVGGNIHSHAEYVKLPSFEERAQLSALILMKIASGDYDAIAVRNMVGGTI